MLWNDSKNEYLFKSPKTDSASQGLMGGLHMWDQNIFQHTHKTYALFLTQWNVHHFPDETFKWIFLNENIRISTKMALKFVSKGPINKIPALVHIMAWGQPGNKPLSDPMTVSLLMHICITWHQWVNHHTVQLL